MRDKTHKNPGKKLLETKVSYAQLNLCDTRVLSQSNNKLMIDSFIHAFNQSFIDLQ